MSYTAILLYLDAYSAQEKLLRFAVNLTQRFNATLIGISALAVRPQLVAEEIVIEGMSELEILANLSTKEKWFREAAGYPKIEWRSIVDVPADALVREARAADLIVIGQSEGEGDAYSALDPAAVILKSGRPVVVVPIGTTSLQAEHVMIGWKETREARRAVHDVLPLLKRARQVTIVEMCNPGDKEKAWRCVIDVALFLSRHEIEAKTEVVIESEESSGAQLVRFAQDRGADLLVTGAYGHSRLGEWVFGGMTRYLLRASPICCLMSH
jgi:nucleotide-binding universal stress UspA family protein